LQSECEQPVFYLKVKADVTEALALQRQLNQADGGDILLADFVVRAASLAVQRYPVMGGRLVDDAIELPEHIDIALSLPDGTELLTVVISRAETKSPVEIATERKELLETAHRSRDAVNRLAQACITVTDLGVCRVESFIPLVPPGRAAALGAGAVAECFIPDDHSYTVRSQLTLAMTVDHRIANGAYASQFLDLIKKILQDPSSFA